MPNEQLKIIYTKTDEAPALATRSLLPILRAFTASSGVEFDLRDISLAGRIRSSFPDNLTDDQKLNDALSELGDLVKTPAANIIKLPNISASIPQLQATITELQGQGYDVPDYPEDPETDEEVSIQSRFAKVLGSAVNPVLREGNSDRRVAAPVKAYAQANPHPMGEWSSTSQTHVAHMPDGDFFGSEQSHVMSAAGSVRIELQTSGGETIVLRDGLELQDSEVIDASVMSRQSLRDFLAVEIEDARERDLLFSLHMKATMMKVSDPIIFGHAVTVYYSDVFQKHAAVLDELGVDPNNGIGDLYAKLEGVGAERSELADEIRADVEAVYGSRPRLAMVNSDLGITNLHVPSDIIIDASMPVVVRDSGTMWGPDGGQHDVKCVIPDRCYAGVYQAVLDFCREHGAFDVTTMGNVSNVGLMAQKAEEYGSHDKTFEIPVAGTVRTVDESGQVLTEHTVQAGDIWRMCQTRDIAIRDWVRLAVSRARATGAPAIFWLNAERAHDATLITKVQQYLAEHDTEGLEIQVLSPVEATRLSCQRARDGLDTISVTGNVLRDYLTDLFPILELGTSAKMLSIVPLLAGGGLYETGAGGSAPKHVQQFNAEGHLRWDSLGEFLALGVSLEDMAEKTGNERVRIHSESLNQAIEQVLTNRKAPSRKVNELDNRGSHFYLALFWAQALVEQSDDAGLQEEFRGLAEVLAENETRIVDELNAAQGQPMDIGGYYQPDDSRADAAMRPSETFNEAIASLSSD
ncbi:MAG: NADP-dependent isocitrate dehydrogenase [Planctomycetaceae bacterium]